MVRTFDDENTGNCSYKVCSARLRCTKVASALALPVSAAPPLSVEAAAVPWSGVEQAGARIRAVAAQRRSVDAGSRRGLIFC